MNNTRIAAVFAVMLFCNSALTDESTGINDDSVRAAQPVTVGGEAGADDLPALSADRAMELAREWTAAGKPEQAFRLLRLVMQAARDEGDIDTTDIRFLAAQALLKMRRPAHAAVILGQLAEERPELNRVRLDYAAALFTLGRDERAGDIFRGLRRQENLPASVRRNVERFLERIRARQKFQVNFDFGFWRDNNVNHAPERDSVEAPVFGGLEFELDEQAVSAWVARTGLNLRWRHTPLMGGRLYFETRAAATRNTAINASEHNRTWLNLSSGARWRYAMTLAGQRQPGMVRADLGGERRWRGGDSYAVSGWARLGLEQALNRNWRVNAAARVWDTRYDHLHNDLDPFGQSLELRLTRNIGIGYLTAGAEIARESTESPNLRWQSWGTSLAYTTIIRQNWNLSAKASRHERYYKGENPLFRKRREDRTLAATLTVSNRAIAWAGYMPELTLGWIQTNSTIPLYDRKNRIVLLGLRRLF